MRIGPRAIPPSVTADFHSRTPDFQNSRFPELQICTAKFQISRFALQRFVCTPRLQSSRLAEFQSRTPDLHSKSSSNPCFRIPTSAVLRIWSCANLEFWSTKLEVCISPEWSSENLEFLTFEVLETWSSGVLKTWKLWTLELTEVGREEVGVSVYTYEIYIGIHR